MLSSNLNFFSLVIFTPHLKIEANIEHFIFEYP